MIHWKPQRYNHTKEKEGRNECMNNGGNTGKKFDIPFSIGTNFDPQLIKNIKAYNERGVVKSVFGKLKRDFLGGGRASSFLPEISMKELEEYIQLCHRNNLEFNYLINPMCLENKDLESDTHKQIVRYIDELSNLGIDAITINSPYLCELIKKQFPHLRVTIGLYAYIHDLNLLKRWIELGADEITLAHGVNRDFNILEKMLTYTKGMNVSLRVIANNVCLRMCPYAMMHGTIQSHTSQNGSHVRGDIDYCMMKCLSTKIGRMANFISSDWIRPEDLSYYEQLSHKTGNYNFSIKLVERTKTTDFLTRVVKAYTERSYNGNLLDILLWPTYKEMLIKQEKAAEDKALETLYNIEEYKKYAGIYNLPDIYIDNTKLDGFLERFVKGNDCSSKICGDAEQKGPDICSYCSKWAKKVIRYNQEKVDIWLENCNDFQHGLQTSKVFMV